MSYKTLQEKIEESAKKKLRDKISSIMSPLQIFCSGLSVKILAKKSSIDISEDGDAVIRIGTSDLMNMVSEQIFNAKTDSFIKDEQQNFLNEIEQLKKDNLDLQERIRHLEYGSDA